MEKHSEINQAIEEYLRRGGTIKVVDAKPGELELSKVCGLDPEDVEFFSTFDEWNNERPNR